MASGPTYESDLAAVRGHLDDPAVAAAWAKGEAMTLEQAVACALRDETVRRSSGPRDRTPSAVRPC
jgi:hypothetical protein